MSLSLLSESLILVGVVGYMNCYYFGDDVCSVDNTREEKQVEEVKVQHFKNEVAKVADEFEQKKGVAASNMNRNQKAGLKMIKEKLKDEEMVCFVTDKSGRWACDSLEN